MALQFLLKYPVGRQAAMVCANERPSPAPADIETLSIFSGVFTTPYAPILQISENSDRMN